MKLNHARIFTHLPLLTLLLALLPLCSCTGAGEETSPEERARMSARNDARAIINREWPDTLSLAEAAGVLKDSAEAIFAARGHPELSKTYDAAFDSTVRTVLKRRKTEAGDSK